MEASGGGAAYSWQGYALAFALLAVSVVRAILMQLHFNGKMVTAQNIRSTIAAAAYRKVSQGEGLRVSGVRMSEG